MATKYVAYTVNGVVADAAGNITLSAGSSYTASNGLTLVGSNFRLGGSLTVSTAITAGVHDISISGSSASTDNPQFGVYNSSNGIAIYGETATNGGFGVQGVATTGATSIGVSAYGNGGSIPLYVSSDSLSGFFQINNSTNNNVIPILRLLRTVVIAGGSANGYGSSIDISNQTTTNSNVLSNQIISKWSNATNASRTSEFSITGVNNAITKTYTFPPFINDRYIPLSVNGNFADSSGNITISIISSVAWGTITGTLSSQTDLQNALNLKTVDILAGYVSASGTVTNGDTIKQALQKIEGKVISNQITINQKINSSAANFNQSII